MSAASSPHFPAVFPDASELSANRPLNNMDSRFLLSHVLELVGTGVLNRPLNIGLTIISHCLLKKCTYLSYTTTDKGCVPRLQLQLSVMLKSLIKLK